MYRFLRELGEHQLVPARVGCAVPLRVLDREEVMDRDNLSAVGDRACAAGAPEKATRSQTRQRNLLPKVAECALALARCKQLGFAVQAIYDLMRVALHTGDAVRPIARIDYKGRVRGCFWAVLCLHGLHSSFGLHFQLALNACCSSYCE
jgi:hypothetical protein